MIIQITPPDPYSTVKRPVVFRIYRDQTTTCEVEVNSSKKLLPANTNGVNVASYYQGDMNIYPKLWGYGVLLARNWIDWGRAQMASIAVDGVTSAEVPLIDAQKICSRDRIMSDMKRRVIDRGQVDEISVFMATPGTVAYGKEKVAVGTGMSQIVFCVPDEAPEQFSVVLRDGIGREIDRVEYEVSSDCEVRLAWINPYGAIDFWNFDSRRKIVTKITRERIYTREGYITTSVQSEVTRTVATQALTDEQIAVLSQIFTADVVWLIEGESYTQIDVVTDSATTFEADKLCSIQVDYRNKLRDI